MKKLVKPFSFSGSILAPPSKSQTIRAIIAAMLANGKSVINRPLISQDTMAALNCAKAFGAKADISGESIIIQGGLNSDLNVVNCGESALCARMFAPIAGLLGKEVMINGVGTLLNRDLREIENELIKFGLKVDSQNSRLPLAINGKIKGADVKIDSSSTSQLLSGLLFALPLANEDSIIRSQYIASRPYIDMSLETLGKFGVKIIEDPLNTFLIKGAQTYQPTIIDIEGDWSSSAFWLCAGAIAGIIELSNLNSNTKQADVKILTAIKLCGAKVSFNNNSIIVEKKLLKSFEFDASDCPDLFPALTVLAANCEGVTRIKGVGRLFNKESNRANSLIEMFTNLGIKIYIDGDCLSIIGGRINGGSVSSHNDHRIAMTAAIASLSSEKEIEIDNENCVAKSYPEFWNDFEKLVSH